MGAGLQRKMKVWRNPAVNLVSIEFNKGKKTPKNAPVEEKPCVIATYDMPDVNAKLTMTYAFCEDGSVEVAEKMTVDHAKKTPEMFRFGVVHAAAEVDGQKHVLRSRTD